MTDRYMFDGEHLVTAPYSSLTPQGSALRSRVPIGKVSPEACLVLEIESSIKSPMARGLVERLDQIRNLVLTGRITWRQAVPLLSKLCAKLERLHLVPTETKHATAP
jgi:hypothetical protein